jgi:hypothetical protein
MAHSYHHAVSSTRKFGGAPEDYIAIHAGFDESEAIIADFRHRALRHHAEGIFLAERVFGVTITNRSVAPSQSTSSANSTASRASASSLRSQTGSGAFGLSPGWGEPAACSSKMAM